MKIVNNPYPMGSFCATQRELNKDKNPISKSGERSGLLAATVAAGVCVGGRALLYLVEDGFVFDELFDFSYNTVEKNKKNVKGANKALVHLGAFAAVVVAFVAAVAAFYTICKTPEIMYKGKVNAFVKGKDMDIYSKSNNIEKDLYDQMNEKAKGATAEEKEALKQQYIKLKTAKNPTPDFIPKDKLATPSV